MSYMNFPWREIKSENPFVVTRLPLIAQLRQLGFHRFKRKWTKRLFKRPGRWLFDVVYHFLNLQGTGVINFRHPGGTIPLTFDGRNLHFSTLYDYEFSQVFEPQVMGLLELLIRRDEVFFDVGANWGMESLHAAVLDEWRGHIHAFEPVERTFNDLQSLISQAALENRITPHHIALSDETGTARMEVSDLDSGSSKLIESSALLGQEVRRAKIDDLGLPDPTFIKLDVEGHEAQVCLGARKTIASSRPFIIFETWSTSTDYLNSESVFNTLTDFGYVFFRPAWWRVDGSEHSIWPQTQPPSDHIRRLTLIPMDRKIRPFMEDHIDVFACHEQRLSDLYQRFSGGDRQ